jgi:HSP20 family protein
MVFRRMNPVLPVTQLRDEMDRLVNDFFTPAAENAVARWGRAVQSYPPLNVWEEGDTLWAEAEIPGVKSEDLDISVINGDLTIRGRRQPTEQVGAVYHRQERGVGEFNRVLRLPFDVEAGQVEATLNDGVLLVKLPKAESAKPKKIKVSIG